MAFENFNQTNASGNNQPGLNFCDIMEVGKTLKKDIVTHGPGMLQDGVNEAVKHPERVAGAVCAGALIAVGVAAELPAVIGLASAAGLTMAGGVLLGTVLSKVEVENNNNNNNNNNNR